MQASTEMVKNKGKKDKISEHMKVFSLALREIMVWKLQMEFFLCSVVLKEAHFLLKDRRVEKKCQSEVYAM